MSMRNSGSVRSVRETGTGGKVRPVVSRRGCRRIFPDGSGRRRGAVVPVAADGCETPRKCLSSCRYDDARLSVRNFPAVLSGTVCGLRMRFARRMPVYTGTRELLAELTGYALTRGVLCAMRRPQPPSAEEVCRNSRRIVVIDGVTDTTNIGAIFRSAAALGIDGVLLTPTSCDPLNRRSVRVSMGSVFLVPWTWLDRPIDSLNELGLRTVAMALTDDSIPIDDPILAAEPRLAMVMGTEGDGLSQETIASTDYVARIPMSHNVDSLNVAAAAAVAFWQLRPK